MTIDGNSLATDDLLQLGRGRYKIKVHDYHMFGNFPSLLNYFF